MAASSDSNSAMTVEPVNPAAPGSLLSTAGSGPAVSNLPSSCSSCKRARWAGRTERRFSRESAISSA
nr:MAG TPA: hypothetical protein [Caudoviricetes sp.]